MIKYAIAVAIALAMVTLSVSSAVPAGATISNGYNIQASSIADKVYLTYGPAFFYLGNISVNNTGNSFIIGSGSTIYLNAKEFVGGFILLLSYALQVNDSLSPNHAVQLWINGTIPYNITVLAQNDTSSYVISNNTVFNLSNNVPLYFTFFAFSSNNNETFSLNFNYIIDHKIVIEDTYNFVLD
ncbi:hypothetical protein DMB44_02545 [Thermoplasma sp. Kam2015]|uniref:hypothetical protein n=1 Tax=Thermoplasma sp. Kam2015 TaxID=2094122 RepID=UPI000D8F31BF|nr:hypothetical protein [Thermoplasma sp. Kam2015]PYB68768.1 hypothetical protein DMB44_02545 [Thermoplasma sp. Kam2015]